MVVEILGVDAPDVGDEDGFSMDWTKSTTRCSWDGGRVGALFMVVDDNARYEVDLSGPGTACHEDDGVLAVIKGFENQIGD